RGRREQPEQVSGDAELVAHSSPTGCDRSDDDVSAGRPAMHDDSDRAAVGGVLRCHRLRHRQGGRAATAGSTWQLSRTWPRAGWGIPRVLREPPATNESAMRETRAFWGAHHRVTSKARSTIPGGRRSRVTLTIAV